VLVVLRAVRKVLGGSDFGRADARAARRRVMQVLRTGMLVVGMLVRLLRFEDV
jgi:hypothetical protein